MNQILREIGLQKDGENSSIGSDFDGSPPKYDGSATTGKYPEAAGLNFFTNHKIFRFYLFGSRAYKVIFRFEDIVPKRFPYYYMKELTKNK